MEIEYYYNENGKQLGPFTLEKLSSKPITNDTLVWHKGLNDWTQASEITELKNIIKESPTPPALETNIQNVYSKYNVIPKNFLVESILVTIFCLPFGIPALIYAARVTPKYFLGDIEGAKEDSKSAKKWCLIGLIALIAYIVAYVIFVVAFIFLIPKIPDLIPQ